jgi:hypothetical protein
MPVGTARQQGTPPLGASFWMSMPSCISLLATKSEPVLDGNKTVTLMATGSKLCCQEMRYSQGDTINNRIQSRRRDYESYNTISGYLS